MKKETFVCDTCGRKQRLDITKRHWCDFCAGTKETELRPVRVKAAMGAGQPVGGFWS